MNAGAWPQNLMIDSNRTEASYPRDACLHALFEAQAARTPQAVAVVCEDQALSYEELNRRANRVAHTLRGHGVAPDTLVGISLERSLEMVVGLLGILKAGGAYVPLDPSYPEERLAFMLEDAGVSVLLTQQALTGRLPAHRAAVLCLDADWARIAQAPADNPAPISRANHLAYVIYTSGSTGRPKGVMVPHRAVCNHLFWMQEHFPLTAADSVLQKTPFSFDPSVWEFFGPLTQGARLVMARPGTHMDSAYLVEVIRRERITMLEVVPSLIRILLEDPGIGQCASLRHVFSGGELLPPELIRRFYANTRAELYNLYGPTEATINATMWRCSEDIQTAKAPIGRPIANTRIYLLDEHMQPVPVGAAGEIYIGGAGLARGYWNRPDLTAERFVPDPFRGDPESRLYKTGDLARYLPDGNIDFLGRVDHQVKLRGFRIELGEIEAVLAGHSGVREAVVLLREDVPGDQRLVAYVVRQGHDPTARVLQVFLKEKLPDYMVPASFVFIDQIPLLPNGKFNRDAFPAPEHSAVEAAERAREPNDLLELQLASLWEDLLGVTNVSVLDNFFDLGGHSLLATRMVAQIEAIFGKQLSVASVFEHPTIEGLAGVLRQQHVQLSGTGLIPLRTTSGKVPFFCIFGNAAVLARHMDKDQPVYWFWSKHHDERGHLSRTSSAEEIAAYYLREIRQIQPQGPYLLGGYCVGATLVYEIARQLGNAQQEVALLVLIDPFKADHYGLYDRINYELSSLENRQGDINKFSYLVMERGLPRIKRWLAHRFQGRPPRSASGMSPDTAGQQERLYLHPLAASALGRYALQPSDAPTLFFMPGIMWLQRKKGGYLRPPPFWGRLLRGMLASYYVPGADHEQLLKEPYVLEIARLLNQHLQDCQDAIRRRGTTH